MEAIWQGLDSLHVHTVAWVICKVILNIWPGMSAKSRSPQMADDTSHDSQEKAGAHCKMLSLLWTACHGIRPRHPNLPGAARMHQRSRTDRIHSLSGTQVLLSPLQQAFQDEARTISTYIKTPQQRDSLAGPDMDMAPIKMQDLSEASHLAWSCAVDGIWLACITQQRPHLTYWTCQQTSGRSAAAGHPCTFSGFPTLAFKVPKHFCLGLSEEFWVCTGDCTGMRRSV